MSGYLATRHFKNVVFDNDIFVIKHTLSSLMMYLPSVDGFHHYGENEASTQTMIELPLSFASRPFSFANSVVLLRYMNYNGGLALFYRKGGLILSYLWSYLIVIHRIGDVLICYTRIKGDK